MPEKNNSKRKIGITVLIVSIIANLLLGGILIQQKKGDKPTQDQLIKSKTSAELLTKPILLTGDKTFSSQEIPLPPEILKGKNTMNITYNLHGLCALPGQASQIAFLDNKKKSYPISLADYGKNCQEGEQNISVPLSAFTRLNTTEKNLTFTVKIWYPTSYHIEITNAIVYQDVLGASTKAITDTQTSTTPAIVDNTSSSSAGEISIGKNTGPSWIIQSVSAMKETKDKICTPRSTAFINQWVTTAKNLGVNYISIETPYDSPSCGDSIAYTKKWIDAIRSQNIHIWHRHMPLSFEGLYGVQKDISINYIATIASYIKNNPDFFMPGDIFTPIPEPQNGGIKGVTYCSQQACMFNSAADFNQWLREAMTASQKSFASIGLAQKMKIGYYGFDGFITWGDNNPNWHGILEKKTILQMGNITIDHYPEAVGETMNKSLNDLQKKYPNIPIVIGEWGTITASNNQEAVTQIMSTMKAAQRKNIIGFNYWHMGMTGNESLIDEDFTTKPQYAAVQSFFLPPSK